MYVQHVIMDQDYVYGGKTKKENWATFEIRIFLKERQIILHFIIRIDFFLQTHHLTAWLKLSVCPLYRRVQRPICLFWHPATLPLLLGRLQWLTVCCWQQQKHGSVLQAIDWDTFYICMAHIHIIQILQIRRWFMTMAGIDNNRQTGISSDITVCLLWVITQILSIKKNVFLCVF